MSAITSDIVISSDPENLSKVEEFIEKVCAEYEVGPDVYGNILISTTEAVNNALIHGNQGDESKEVQVLCEVDQEAKTILFIIKDQGEGFDYSNLADPTAPENLTMIGGRGVFLIKQLADWVVFSDEGSTVELKFNI